MKDIILAELEQAHRILEAFRADPDRIEAIEAAARIMSEALRQGHKIISCGNGGSMSDAMHFAEELTGRFRHNRPALPAIAISDPAYLTCVGNDYGYEAVFSRFIEGMGQQGDVLLAISTSGNSPNVLRAIEAARHRGMKVVGLTGKGGGAMADRCDVEIRAPRSPYSDRAQEIHIKVIHVLILLIEKSLTTPPAP